MLGTPLDCRVRRVLGVTLEEGLALTLDDDATAYFPAHVTVPGSDNSTFEGSPRNGLSSWRLTWQSAPAEFAACDRIEVPADAVYELLADPRPVTNGRRTIGFSAPMLPVSDLYPRSAELRDLGGDVALATVACAVFQGRESHNQRGTYHDTFCELPPSAWQYITPKKTQTLHFADGSVWKIAEAALGSEVPFVTASLRKAG
jgi:hypothetical protein